MDDEPASAFREKVTLRATVVKVTDGDSLRVRHLPLLRSAPEGTLKIRLCAVDAPETAHFGNKAQPLGEAAKQFVKDKVEGRTVKVKLLSRDQYGRAVGRVTYAGGLCRLQKKDVSEELLDAGLATVYRKGGAQYDGDLKTWDTIEARAKANKRGIWQNNKATVRTIIILVF